MLRVLDLFSGIGGFSLGLERTGGFETKAFCEIDPFCRRVLAKHWPRVPCYNDVRELAANDIGAVDAICGGFPCQDISWAGYGAGLAGNRSGLWSEFFRLISELRPAVVTVENVAALLHRGLDVICGDLARIGYDAEWSFVSACSVGAPHMRQRMFIVAYPNGEHGRSRIRNTASRSHGPIQAVGNFSSSRARWRARMANPSELYRGADGLPNGMDRNRAVGNSVAPDVAELIGNTILTSLKQAEAA